MTTESVTEEEITDGAQSTGLPDEPEIKAFQPEPLHGTALTAAGLMLAVANFMVVLDMTISNVSVTHIAGSLAISPNEGTYVITSYAVAEAISVPLSGWLAKRFGTLRTFSVCMALFGIFSAVCGFSNSLMMLVAARVAQGLVGGPIMPLTQTLLLEIFPKSKRATALTLWSMTTMIAPVAGPIVGGYFCDNWGWEYAFFINIPVALIGSFMAYTTLRRFETPIIKAAVDFVGMIFLVIWVSALQIMLDEGKNWDWFNSSLTCILLAISVIGFICFMIWELTEEHPIVDIRVFRHRGFSASVLTISLAFGAYFGSVVLTPLWLQNYMDYTATWSGLTTCATGVLAIMVAPLAARWSQKIDSRRLVFMGVTWMGLWTFVRAFANTDMDYTQIAWPMLMQGLGTPFFFIPLMGLALASVRPEETASAAGLLNFCRTFAGAIATSIVTTAWDDSATTFRSDMVGRLPSSHQIANIIGDTSAAGQEIARGLLDMDLQGQVIMMSTNHIFQVVAFMFAFAASAIWLAPKPRRKADTSAAH